MSTDQNRSAEMPFLQHFAELRRRIVYILIGIVVATLFLYSRVEQVFPFFTAPIRENFQTVELIGTSPIEAFMCKLRVAIVLGLVLSLPWSFLQLWLFIAPGLLPKEKKYALPFIFCTTLFFVAGVLFAFYFVLPVALGFFSTEFMSIGLAPTIRIGEYLEFAVKLILIFGLIFELPIVSFFLARFGLLSARWLKKYIRYILVGIFVIAGILSPPDVISQLLLAGPLLLIYGLCFLICFFFEKKKSKEVL